MKIVAISDTHNQLGAIDVPEGDILIHAGDATMMGREDEIVKFFHDLENLKDRFDNIIFIAGNHDFMPEKDPGGFRALIPLEITYLEDTGVEIEGVKFWGTPWVKGLPRWAFNEDDPVKRAERWKQIPDDVDVLISHGPPYRILDRILRERIGEDPNVGCKLLFDEVMERIKPEYMIFGHIHERAGWREMGGTKFINASLLDENYRIKNKPVIFNIEKDI